MKQDNVGEMSKMTDCELVILFQKGNPFTIGEILKRYKNCVIARANSFQDSDYWREDLLQEGNVGLLKAVMNYNESQNVPFSAFAYVCILNEMKKFYEAAVSKHSKLEPIPVDDDGSISDEKILVEDRIVGEMSADDLFKTLTELEKNVLIGRCSDKSYAEIAKSLSVSTKSVDNAVMRIKHKLQNSDNMPQ